MSEFRAPPYQSHAVTRTFTVASNASLLASDNGTNYLVDSSDGDIFLTLPAAPATGTTYSFAHTGSANKVRLSATSPDFIIWDNNRWLEMDAQGDSVRLRYANGKWWAF